MIVAGEVVGKVNRATGYEVAASAVRSDGPIVSGRAAPAAAYADRPSR